MTENSNKTAGYESIRRFLHNRIFGKKAVINLLGIIMIAYTAVLIFRICESNLTNVSIPNEYREAANILLTKAFMEGTNPYRLSAYEGELPGMIYVYGPLYSVFTAFLARILPFVDLIRLHYLVTFFSVIIAAGLSACMVFKYTKNTAAAASAFLFLINCSWRYGYINAVPDAFALMIYVVIIYLMSREGSEKQTGKSNKTLKNILYALLAASLFFIKQYFVLIVVPIFIYKFIYDRRDALKFFLTCLIISVITFITVTITCPLYWTYSVYLAHGPFGITQEQYHKAYGGYMEDNVKAAAEKEQAEKEKGESQKEQISEKDETEEQSFKAGSLNTDPEAGFGYEILQLKSLAGMFIFIFAATAWGVILRLTGRSLKEPKFMTFLILLMITSFIALIYLGRNDGAWLSYYLQLLMPEVIIFAFIFIDRILENEKGVKKIAAFSLFLLMMFFTAFRTNGRLKVYSKTADQLNDWKRAYEITAGYADKGEVYYVPLLGFQTLYNGQYMYNNGHSMVITGWFRGEYFAVDWEQVLFPHGDIVMQRNYDYQEKIKEKARSQDYSLVTIIDGTDTDFERLSVNDLKKDGYKKIDSILLNAGRMSYEVQFWIPQTQ